MISGAMRGKGIGDALAKHLIEPENDEVRVITPRGLGSPDLIGQVRELVALALLWQIEGTRQFLADSHAMVMVMDDHDVRCLRVA